MTVGRRGRGFRCGEPCRILRRFDHRRRLQHVAHHRDHRGSPQDRRTREDQNDADHDGALERKTAAACAARAAFFLSAFLSGRGRGARLLRRRCPARGFLGGFVVAVRQVRIGAAVFHAGLEPVELRRRRRHIGIGFTRRAVGLRRGAAEIVGVGGDIAETAHARRLGLVRRLRPGSARRGAPGAGRGPAAGRIRHSGRGLRRLRPRRRLRPAGRRARRLRGCGGARRDRLARAGGRLAPADRLAWRRGGCRRGTHRRHGGRRARPRARAGRPRIRPCARPLPATAARG